MRKMQTSHRIPKRELEKNLGLCMWCASIFPVMKPQLHWLYSDLARIPARFYSASPSQWPLIKQALKQHCVFNHTPVGTSLPTGGKLVTVRHVPIHHLEDLNKVLNTIH